MRLKVAVLGLILSALVGFMRNDSARLTPRGELVADVLTILIGVAMGYAILRAFAVVVVRLGQVLGIV
jgi:hypothetical protein